MKCYIGKFKTENNMDDICRNLLSFLSNEDILNIFEENIVLKLKCNLFKKTDIINLPREKIEKGIMELYKTNEEIKNSISKQWNKKITGANKVMDALGVDKIENILKNEEDVKSLFEYSTLLWSKNGQKDNSLGDMAYEMYLSKKDDNKCEKGGCKMDNSILNISLGQIIELSKGENTEKQEQLGVAIKTNSDEIKKLSQQMKIFIEFNKEIKKLLNGMADQIKTLTKEVTSGEASNKVSSICQELKEVSIEIKQVKQVNEKSEQVHKKEISIVNSNIKGISDAIKTQNKILEKLEGANKELKQDLDNISGEVSNLVITNVNNNNNNINKGQGTDEINFGKALKESLESTANIKQIEQKNNRNKVEGVSSAFDKEENTLGELLDELLKDK